MCVRVPRDDPLGAVHRGAGTDKGADMYDASWQPDETPLGCDCVDCRMYRVWETEGTDDWQPQAEGWSAWTATPQMADTGSESRGA